MSMSMCTLGIVWLLKSQDANCCNVNSIDHNVGSMEICGNGWYRGNNLTSSLDVRRQRSNNNYATNQSYVGFRQSYYDSKNVHESARQREERSIQKLIAEIEKIAK